TYSLPTTSGTGTLRGAAAAKHPGLYVGAALTSDSLNDAVAPEQTTAGSQFNLVASSNQMYWSADENAGPGIFNFCDGDQFVAFAQAYHQDLRLHNLVAGQPALGQVPNWVQSPAVPWTAPWLEAIMKQYITTVVNHYRNSVSVFDVVNEAVASDGTPQSNIFEQVIGYPKYVELAFDYAYEADP